MLKVEQSQSHFLKMIFGELLCRLTTQIRAIARKLEKLNSKSVQSSFGIKFNKTCIKEDIMPEKYMCICS